MIDYEKLKQVNIMNEDIGKYYLSISIYRNEILAIELARKPEFMKEIYCDQFFNNDIDALFEFLSKIQLQEEPRYKVGDILWFETNKVIIQAKIDEINQPDYHLTSIISPSVGFTVHELNLYPTKQSLIEAQVSYWQGLLPFEGSIFICEKCGTSTPNPRLPLICSKCDEECQHESDGKTYFQTPEGSESLLILCKCKKCGEFYR